MATANGSLPPQGDHRGPERPPVPQHESARSARVTLSNTSVLPMNVLTTFKIAQELGYDGVEIMPTVLDPISLSVKHLQRLQDRYQIPVASIHAPCLGPATAGVWGRNPQAQLAASKTAAERLGAGVVVVHPPFWWQPGYVQGFMKLLTDLQVSTEVKIAVENMFPQQTVKGYRPDWNPVGPGWGSEGPEWATLDVSHAAAADVDPNKMADAYGDRLAHVHLSDSEEGVDKHMVPGRGMQPCAELLRKLAGDGYTGDICMEINNRFATRNEREKRLAEAIAFVDTHWPSRR